MKEIKDLLKEVSDKLNEDSYVYCVSFKHDTNTLTKFKKEFSDYKFEEVEKLTFISKKMKQSECDIYEKRLKEFSIKNYKDISLDEKDFFNLSINYYKEMTGFSEKINSELKNDKIDQIKKVKNYEENVLQYNKKLLDSKFEEKYIKEITKFIKEATDSSEFEKINNTSISNVIKEIYKISKFIADKNIFEFSPLENFSIAINSTIYNAYNKVSPFERLGVEESSLLSSNNKIEVNGFDFNKLEDIFKLKYKNTESITAIKSGYALGELEDKLKYRYISTDTVMKGFIFSKERHINNSYDVFSTILKEVSKTAIDEVKVKRSNEIVNELRIASQQMNGKDINNYLIKFMNENRFNLKDDWNKQLDNIYRKIENKKRQKNTLK